MPESTYSTIAVPDTGIDIVGAQDDQMLIFYNRSPATFGADRYLLTNPAGDEGSFVGADMIGQVHTEKFFFFLGLTAGRSEGIAANRGFGPLENDNGVMGDAYVNPNSLAHAQGRTFTERGYTIKTAATYTFPHDFTLGLIGRYQDGQHFARLVILPGPEPGRGGGARVPQRPHPLHVRDDRRRAAAERLHHRRPPRGCRSSTPTICSTSISRSRRSRCRAPPRA